ncbi:MAG TPA: HIT domain-containing protein [Candidatus Nanoarchaeia archaeon]|nr:HIT domain-containing protein [Candidatus Nanoarchaeia archaeon]
MAEAPKLTEEQAKALQEKLKNMPPEELERLQRENCIFCKIIHGEMQTRKIYEDDVCLVTLDIAPASKGHLLIIPKEHYSIMPQVPDRVLAYICVIAKRFSQIVLRTLKVSGTNIFIANGSVAGQRAQHFLLHLIPRKEGDKVLDLQEKIINQEMVENVKIAVEDKLFQLMGVKKPESKTENLPRIQEPAEMEQEEGSKPEKKISTRKKTPILKKSPSVEIVNEEPAKEKQPEEEEANLNDIANLFR